VLLFLMPMYAIRRVPSMRKYSGAASNVFVVVVGLVALTSVVYGLVS
jgi:serine transporter